MSKRPKILERERRLPASPRGMTIRDFCNLYSVGKTHVYREIATGRLKAKKSGRRTLIAAHDAEMWLSSLPEIREEPDEAAP
jgi:excisionase family DNA binding protein